MSDVKDKTCKILICGGGRKNIYLIDRIKNTLPKNLIIQPIDDYGFDGDYIHAKFSRKILLFYLNMNNSSDFLSRKTANCLINKNKLSSDKLIKFIKNYKEKAKLDLEIIVYSDID